MPHRSTRPLRRSVLVAALAMAGIGMSPATLMAATRVPLEWPLPQERSATLTPLRERMLALQATQPAAATRGAATLVITTCADDGSAGSLRTLVESAVSGDVIDLSALDCGRITLVDGVLDIEAEDITFRGPGADLLAIDGGRQDRVLRHASRGELTIEGLTIERGMHRASGTDVGYGGCIAAGNRLNLIGSIVRDCEAVGVGSYGGGVLSGPLTMRNSTISGNLAFGHHETNGTAAYGGGAFSYGVDLLDSTISGNRALGTHNPPLTHWEIGGGVFVARNGGLIERTTISDNYAIRFAGGLTQEGDLILRNSTVSGNRVRDDDGGGVRVRQVTSIVIENSTIANNEAGSFGGGISFINFAQPSVMRSSIIAGNRAGGSNDDAASTMTLAISGSHNLVGRVDAMLALPADTLALDPRLLPLANNGGATLTHALSAGSPAIDAGDNFQALVTDQRGTGHPRVIGATADIGAFEYAGGQGTTAVAVPASSPLQKGLLATLLAAAGGLALMRRRRGDTLTRP